MIAHLLTATAVLVGLMLVLLAVQSLKRRSDPDANTVLSCGSCVTHSCFGCALHDHDHSAHPEH
jgi:hypothetical protein